MSSQASGENRAVSVSTPLAYDVLVLLNMSGTEALGRLFEYHLTLESTDEDIRLEDVLGQPMTVSLELANDEVRFYHGFVSSFTLVECGEDYGNYNAVLKPWLWFLTRTSNCRIFQNLTVPDIVKQVFRDHGFNDFEEQLIGNYRPWKYCVQYRETDFNFISRLLEQEGIYYYFKHEENKHTLILSDSVSAHEAVPGYEEILYRPEGSDAFGGEYIFHWRVGQVVQPGTYVLEDFNALKPKANLEVKASDPRDHAAADYEIYDYPGDYQESADGEVYARTRFEELQTQFEQVWAASQAGGLTTGALFTLADHPRADQNREYLVTSINYSLQSNALHTGAAQSGPTFSCEFESIASQQSFRPARKTSKPIVQGPQTAIVVGKAGEEIWTDEHGRIKVQFHWDREGQFDENSSCWIWVSQVHAGKGFGAVDIPRVGEEVIVEFLEGDPDRPIVTGRVYTGDNKPPVDLPAGGMISGLKSNTTPGGGGSNEIMLDDTKGNEKINIHAQFDMDTTVENNRSATVVSGNDTLSVVAGTQTVTVKGNTSLTVEAGDRIVDVTGNYTLDTTSEISMQAPGKISLTCGGSTIVMEPGKIVISAGGGANLTLDGNADMISSAGSELKLDANATMDSSGGSNVTLDGNAKMSSSGASEVLLDGNATMSSPGEAKVEAPTAILSGGGSTTKADAGGVALTGAKISLNG